MIDIKSESVETYRIIQKILIPYKHWIYRSTVNADGKILVFLSGNRPVSEVFSDPGSLVSIDRRPEEPWERV